MVHKESSNKNKLFLEDYEYRVYRIRHFAQKYGWEFILESKLKPHKIYFFNNDITLIVNPCDLHIQTILSHPQKGKTTLYREGKFTMRLIEQIFINPRSHMPPSIKSTYV